MATKYKKQANGYYKTMVWDGTYVNGRKHYKFLYSKKSSADLEKKVMEYKIKTASAEHYDNIQISFIDYAEKWFKTYKNDKSENTKKMYRIAIDKYLSLIQCPISGVTRAHYAYMMSNIKGTRIKQQVDLTFRQVIKTAIREKVLPSSALIDITEGYDKPKYKSKEKRALTDYEKNAVFKAKLDDRDKTFLYLLYGCGIRRGEAAALTADDFDFEKKTLSINKANAYVNNEVIHKNTKNEKHRIIPIPDSILPTVKKYVLQSGEGEIFKRKNGRPCTHSMLVCQWRRIIEALNEVSEEPIEGLTAHIFRHNYCTTLCYRIPEISLNDVAYLMGDSREVVFRIYNHLNINQESVASTVSKLF